MARLQVGGAESKPLKNRGIFGAPFLRRIHLNPTMKIDVLGAKVFQGGYSNNKMNEFYFSISS